MSEEFKFIGNFTTEGQALVNCEYGCKGMLGVPQRAVVEIVPRIQRMMWVRVCSANNSPPLGHEVNPTSRLKALQQKLSVTLGETQPRICSRLTEHAKLLGKPDEIKLLRYD